jgi:hypothetical protein
MLTGLKCIGCKNVGLNLTNTRNCFPVSRKCRIESFLEVVTHSEEEHFQSVDLALKIGAHNLIGGMPS